MKILLQNIEVTIYLTFLNFVNKKRVVNFSFLFDFLFLFFSS